MKQITYNQEKGQFILHYEELSIGHSVYGCEDNDTRDYDFIVDELDMCETLERMGYVIFDEDNEPVNNALNILNRSFVKLGKVHYPNEERIMDHFIDSAIDENAEDYANGLKDLRG